MDKTENNCPCCGKLTTQLDMRQKDSDGNWWCVTCADDTLAQVARGQYEPTEEDGVID